MLGRRTAIGLVIGCDAPELSVPQELNRNEPAQPTNRSRASMPACASKAAKCIWLD
jgi:hypothetical protein